MMLVVLIAGVGLLMAGLVTIGLGIQLDLSFGNTLLLAGAMVACTGVLMLGLWIAIRELKAIALRLSGLPASSRASGRPTSAGPDQAPGDQAPEGGVFPFSPGQPAADHAGKAEPGEPPAARPWHEEVPRGRGEVPVEAPPVAKPRRNLLFSSSSRKERERAEARGAEPSVAGMDPGTPGAASSVEAPLVESNLAPPATFDDAWPRPERARAPEIPMSRRSGRTPSTFTDAAAAGHAAAGAAGEDRPQVTVLKSGVVDGMAYSLYSDGSIEAQMPEGMMRFESIDELRAHLDQRS